MTDKVLLQTEITGREIHSIGKVRDNYKVIRWPGVDSAPCLLMITTDRISALDIVLPQGVPGLGKLRNMISLDWFQRTRHICPNHVFMDDRNVCVNLVKEQYQGDIQDLYDRGVLVLLTKVVPAECVVRGYISGSAWESYQQDGTVCGIELPPGLKESEELPEPIFTPTTKAETGHDEPLTFDELVELVGAETAEKLRSYSIRLYQFAANRAKKARIIIADTKFEFGFGIKGDRADRLMAIDEMLTPDSSRFWDMDDYEVGRPQSSFDKQPLRDWLRSTGWKGESPPPDVPQDVLQGMGERYLEAQRRLKELK